MLRLLRFFGDRSLRGARRLARREDRRSLGLEPLRRGVRHVFGRFARDVARDLCIPGATGGRSYIADAWINEVKWLG